MAVGSVVTPGPMWDLSGHINSVNTNSNSCILIKVSS